MDNISIDTKLKEKAYRITGRVEDPYINCPKCKKSIPLVQLIITEDKDVLIRINCSKCKSEGVYSIINYISSIINKTPSKIFCQFKDIHKENLAIKYCLQCSKWGCNSCIKEQMSYHHSILSSDINLNIFCTEELHLINKEQKASKYYCNNCLKAICSKCCKEKHLIHQTNEINDTLAQKVLECFSQEKIDQLRLVNKENKDALVTAIDAEISKWMVLKNKLIIAYEENDKVNEDILQLLNLLRKNYDMFKGINKIEGRKSYEIINNIISNFQPKESRIELDISNKLMESTNDFIRFLNENYIVDLKESKQKKSNQYECNDNDGIIASEEITCCIPMKRDRIVYGCTNGDIAIKDISLRNINEVSTKEIILKKHSNIITALVILQDGRLVSASSDQSIIFWVIKTSSPDHSITNEEVKCMTQLKDTRLVTGLVNSTVKLWNVKSFNCTSVIKGHNSSITSVLELNDGRLVTASNDKLIKLWNVRVVYPIDLATLTGHKQGVIAIMLLKNGRMVSVCKDGMMIVWDVNHLAIRAQICIKESIGKINGHSCVLLQLKNENVVVGYDNDVIIWNMRNYKKIEVLKDKEDNNNDNSNLRITGIAESVERDIITTSSYNKMIRIWKVKEDNMLM